MKVLVCGGAGFIGSVLVRNLLKNNFEVVVFDNLSTGHKEALGSATFIAGDLLDKNTLQQVFNKHSFGAVINLAVLSDPLESLQNPYLYFTANSNSILNLLECMREASVKKIIYASSSSVYGRPKVLPVNEDAPLNIESVFAETMNTSEKLLGWHDLLYGIKAISLRCFEVAGATIDGNLGEDKKVNEGLVSTLVKAASSDGVFRLPGSNCNTRDGSFVRDYLHVEDFSDAVLKSIEYLFRNPRSEIFNIGSARGFSVKEVVAEVEAQTGRKLVVIPQPKRKSEPDEVWTDNTRIKTQLNWEPKHSLTDIVQTSLYFHAKHPGGY